MLTDCNSLVTICASKTGPKPSPLDPMQPVMERSHPTSGRPATPADINRNGRPTSIGTSGRHQSECPADIIGMRTALEAPVEAVHNEVFNVGITTENYRIREIAEIVEETVPCSRVEFAAGAGPDKRTYRVDCSKIARLLPKFRPQWTARRGARDLYNKYTEHGLLLEDFEGERYQRLAYLQSLMARGAIDVNLRWVVPAANLETSAAPSHKTV